MAVAATFIFILIVGITIPIDAAQTGYDARELQTLIEILRDSFKIEKKADGESPVDKLGETKKQTKYNYAECVFINNADLDPATAAKNDIRGTASMKQEKSGGTLFININVEGIDPKSSKQHGFHVHELGDLSNGCTSTGSHFNPEGLNHGGPKNVERHVGDWGNVDRSADGTVDVQITDDLASLAGGNHNIVGRAIVLHEKTDDLGKGGDEESLKTGNAGARLACCVIGLSKTEW